MMGEGGGSAGVHSRRRIPIRGATRLPIVHRLRACIHRPVEIRRASKIQVDNGQRGFDAESCAVAVARLSRVLAEAIVLVRHRAAVT